MQIGTRQPKIGDIIEIIIGMPGPDVSDCEVLSVDEEAGTMELKDLEYERYYLKMNKNHKEKPFTTHLNRRLDIHQPRHPMDYICTWRFKTE